MGDEEADRAALQERLGLSVRKCFRQLYLAPALEAGLVESTVPTKPTSRLQKCRLTREGIHWQDNLIPARDVLAIARMPALQEEARHRKVTIASNEQGLFDSHSAHLCLISSGGLIVYALPVIEIDAVVAGSGPQRSDFPNLAPAARDSPDFDF